MMQNEGERVDLLALPLNPVGRRRPPPPALLLAADALPSPNTHTHTHTIIILLLSLPSSSRGGGDGDQPGLLVMENDNEVIDLLAYR